MAVTPFSGSVTGSGSTTPCQPWGDFTIVLGGTWTGTVYPECSFDKGQTWSRVSADVYGTPVAWTQPGRWIGTENETDVQWRLTYTINTGTLVWRISG